MYVRNINGEMVCIIFIFIIEKYVNCICTVCFKRGRGIFLRASIDHSKLLIAHFVCLIFFFAWVDCKLYPYQVLFGYTSNFVLFMNSVCIIIASKETWLTTLWYCVFGTGCHQTCFLPSLSVPNKIIFLITYMALNCFWFDDHIQYRKNKK